jgi:hypothetical protein
MSEADGGPGRVRARLRLTPPFRDLLRSIVEQVQEAVAQNPDDPGGPSVFELPDRELQAALAHEREEAGATDAAALAKLLARPEFGTKEITLGPEEAEAVMRAMVQVRLRLHETLLQEWSPGELDGEVEVFRLSPGEQQGYACYRILAHLTDDLLGQMDAERP